jgi:hypothetical protein
MAAYLPPGWPTGVHPPGSQEFEQTAVAWLLDVVPPDYRLYGVLRRHPVALAALARHHLAACVEGARQGYRTARTELGDVLPVHGLDAVLAAYRSEGSRLVATARAVDLVARALRGEVFTPQLRDLPERQSRSSAEKERRDRPTGQQDPQDRDQEAGQEVSQGPGQGADQGSDQEVSQGPGRGTGQNGRQDPGGGRPGPGRKAGQGASQNGRQGKSSAGQRGRQQKAAARGAGSGR